MTLSLKASVAIAACNAIVAQAEVGTTNPAPSFTVYSGTMPADIDTALAGNTALFTIVMDEPAFAGAVDNDTDGFAEAIAEPIADTPAIADGVATFYRLFDRTGTAIWQGNVTEANLGGDMELSSVNVIDGVSVVVTSFIIRVPK